MARSFVGRKKRAVMLALGAAVVAAIALLMGTSSTAANNPKPGLDFSIGIDLLGGGVDGCDSTAGPTTCQLRTGSMFTVRAYLHNMGTVPGYTAIAVSIGYTGVTSKQQYPNAWWPDCVLGPTPSSGPGFVWTGCAIGISALPSTYTGLVASHPFTCTADGTITLVQSPSDTALFDDNYKTSTDAAGNETLTIDCVDPLPYPGDTDGDGCPDIKEMGPDHYAGGQRNYLNPWDWMNPRHDGQVRLDDILMVEYQYYIDQGNPAYNPDTDRTYLGPNPWDLGPPDGVERINDILATHGQYYSDCM